MGIGLDIALMHYEMRTLIVNKNLYLAGLISLTALSGPLLSTSVFARTNPVLSPGWSTLQKLGRDELAVTHTFSSQVRSSKFYKTPWVDPKFDQNLKIRYTDAVYRYSLRKKTGTANIQDEVEYQSQMRQLSKDYLSEVQRNQIRIHGKQFKNHIENTDSFDGIEDTPFGVAAFVVGVGMGAPLRLKIGDFASMSARMSAIRNRGEINLDSDLFHSTFFYDGHADTQAVQDVSQPLPGADRTRIQVSRRLPGLGIQSGVTYGTQSRLMNAEFSRELMPNVAAAVGTTIGTASGSSQQNIRLSYGLQF